MDFTLNRFISSLAHIQKQNLDIRLVRNSHRLCSVRKSVLRNLAKFTGEHLSQNLFFNKVAGPDLQLYSKRDSGTDVSL